MNYRKITAIIPTQSLDEVEKKLASIGVPGMTVTKVKGYGDYRNFYAKDTMSDCSRVEIFIEVDKAKQIVNAIASTVHQGMNTNGVIAILPVEEFMHIREFKEDKNNDE